MKVLFLSHTSRVSGAERSLLELIASLPDRVSPYLACPDGDLASRARARGIPLRRIPGTAVGLRLDARRTPEGLRDLARSGWEVGRAARAEGIELLHANSLRAGMIAALTPRGRPATVVHARDLLPAGLPAKLALRLGTARASAVIANSRHTAASLRRESPRLRVVVVHGAVDAERFDPSRFDRDESRARIGLDPDALALGVVGQITPWKAQRDAIAALAELRGGGERCQLVIVGAPKFDDPTTRFDNPGYLRELEGMAERSGLGSSVLFLGEREDVPEILSGLDALLVPSWEEPFGRAVLEGMAMRLPVIATDPGGPREVIDHRVTGLLVPPRRPDLLAALVLELADDPDLRDRIGRQARHRVVESFSQEEHVARVLHTYRRVLGRRARKG